jgi:hypothetical protein
LFIGKERNECMVYPCGQSEGSHLKDIGIGERIIFKFVLKK